MYCRKRNKKKKLVTNRVVMKFINEELAFNCAPNVNVQK